MCVYVNACLSVCVCVCVFECVCDVYMTVAVIGVVL